jgi:hypothetical protein
MPQRRAQIVGNRVGEGFQFVVRRLQFDTAALQFLVQALDGLHGLTTLGV